MPTNTECSELLPLPLGVSREYAKMLSRDYIGIILHYSLLTTSIVWKNKKNRYLTSGVGKVSGSYAVYDGILNPMHLMLYIWAPRYLDGNPLGP